MENNLAEIQPEQPTAAPVQAESAPAQVETPPVEKVEPAQEPDWFRKRIDEITAKRYAEQREADRRYQEAARERDQLRQQLQSQPKDEKPKTLADFEYDESKYQAHLLDVAEKRAEAAARRVRAEETQRSNVERRVRKFQEREIAFEKETKDYRDVAYYAPISEEVASLVQELDSGPEIAYYLGKNRDIALTLNDLPPHIAAVELGRIDAKLSREKAEKLAALEAAKAAKAVTKAPPPPPNLEGANAQVEKDPSEMTDKEFDKWRKKHIAARRSGRT
jgi:hypothetical protein